MIVHGPVEYVRTEKTLLGKPKKIYKAWFGKEYNDIDDTITYIEGRGKPEKQYWVQFTQKQLDLIIEIGSAICKAYNIKEVVGHDMISPRT